MTDVANAAKTSISTVSRYFNNPTMVAPAVAHRIARAAQELSYVRNRAAASTRNKRSGTVGIVIPTLESSIFAEMTESFSSRLLNHDMTMLLTPSLYDRDIEARIVRSFIEHRVDSVVLVGGDHNEEVMDLLEEREVPALLVWNHLAGYRLNSIGVDNQRIGRMAAQHLVDLGHRDIAIISGITDVNDRAAGRSKGALSILESHGVAPKPEWVLQAPYDLGVVKSLVSNLLLNGKPRPTAIIGGNDIIATAAIWAAQSLGLSVPQDMSVIGIGDFKGSAEMVPALTTIRIPARRIGQMAADRIAELIIGQTSGGGFKIENHEIEPDFKFRQSTAPLKPTSI
ncbi:substrate-binding domain-containing protein [Alphaproteobacteria bacterium]|nr:substrate-binding domain-containing protein [Alphaproteobacteria bacterium]